MSTNLRGHYRPEEILYVNDGVVATIFPPQVVRPEIKAIVLPKSCVDIIQDIDLANSFPNLEEFIWPVIKTIPIRMFSLCKNLKYFHTNSCEKFAKEMFFESGITEIILPENFIKLESRCFYNCNSLKVFDMSNIRCNLNIPKYCFFGCTSLNEFNFSKCCKLNEHSFSKTGISRAVLNFPVGVDCFVGPFAFSESDINYLEINGNPRLATNCFAVCKKLINVKLNSDIKRLPTQAFSRDESLQEISGAEGVGYVGSCCFDGCALSTFKCFTNLIEIGKYAFRGNFFTEIKVNAKYIGDYAFAYCSKLKSVTFASNSLAVIARCMIEESNNIEYLDISNTQIKHIPDRMFEKMKLNEIKLPQTIVSIGDKAFFMTNLTKIELPPSVISIGVKAFASCACLKEVVWSPNCNEILGYTFKDCKELLYLTNTENVTAVYDMAFKNTAVNLNLPNLKTVSGFAFVNYNGITDLRGTSVCVNPKYRDCVPDNVLLPYYYH